MVLNFFRKSCKVCCMKEEKDKGIKKEGNWFCSENCIAKYEKSVSKQSKPPCCH